MKQLQKHPPPSIKGNSLTILEKAKQTKTGYRKGKQLSNFTDLHHLGTVRDWWQPQSG